ncbi:MAG TPA: serine/threonine protein kinase [Planctomycetaceae bacterium]|nr:serine/threonine protein kinase [Planctomycetaceae bacterium]
MAHDPSQQNPVEVLAEEFAQRIRSGEHPSITDYVKRYPDHAEEIESLFPSIAMMEQLKQQKRESQDQRSVAVKTPADMPKQLGDFRVLREIGRGGMGIVYEAWQQSLARRVALKVLPTEGIGRSEKQVERFLREAKAAGRLHHTNIVPVFGVGQHGGIYFYVMQLIEGYGLDALIEYHQSQQAPALAETDGEMVMVNTEVSTAHPRTAAVTRWTSDNTQTHGQDKKASPELISPVFPDDAASSASNPLALVTDPEGHLQLGWIQIANIGIQVADAVHYAHRHGILHRDIKPANLLLDQEHNVWITDFGLAKAAENNNLTQTGDVVGTLRYMAPEQFEGTSNAVSEVYSLGITLHELATLQPAFGQESRMELIRQIMEGSVPSLRNVRPDIPRDLETILQKATAREASERYATAQDLAADLQRFRDDRPILARRSTSLQKMRHWSRRNRALAISVSAAACLLVVATITASVGYLWTSRAYSSLTAQQEKTQEAEKEALTQRDKARQQSEHAQHNLEVAMEALERIFASVGQTQASEQLADFDDQQSWVSMPQAQPVTPKEAQLLKDMLTFYDQFIVSNADDTTLQVKRAEAQQRVGKIQLLLGNTKPAESAYRQALETYRQLHEEFPDNETYPLQAIAIKSELGMLCRTDGRLLDSVNHHREALEFLDKLSKPIRQTAAARFRRARIYNLLGLPPQRGSRHGTSDPGMAAKMRDNILQEMGSSRVDLYLQSEQILDDLIRQYPKNANYQIEKVRGLTNMMRVSNRPNILPDPWILWNDAKDIVKQLLAEQPDNANYQYEFALLFVQKLQPGRKQIPLNKIRARLEEAITICDQLYRRYRHVPEYTKLLAKALYNRAEFEVRYTKLRSEPDRLHMAVELFRESIDYQQRLASQFPDVLQYQIRLNQSSHRLSETYERLGRIQDAQAVLELNIKEFDRYLDEHPQFEDARRILIYDYELLATLLDRNGQSRFAQVARDKAQKLRDQFDADPNKDPFHKEPLDDPPS